MQFLAYLVALMVSFSTILLELHWLTSPTPQPKAAIQASAAPPRAKVEGPNAELTPVYPKPETTRSVGSITGAPVPTEAQAEVAAPAAAETSGAAPPTESFTKNVAAAPPAAAPATQSVAAKSQCDIAACARAYSSFNAADCTYQPFEGARQICIKPPAAAQKVAAKSREPKADTAREPMNENSKKAEIARAVQFLRGRKAADEAAQSDEPDGVIVTRSPDARW
jgi:hypothetical protein